MQDKEYYWERKGYIAIQGRDGKMYKFGTNDASNTLDFKFEGEKFGDIHGEFKVSILGLSRETINELSVWNPAEAVKQMRRIQVFAGYASHGMDHPIFDGFIMEAIPTNPPEMWLNMKCLLYIDKTIEKQYVKTGKYIDIFNEIARLAELNPIWLSKKINPNTEIKFTFDNKPSILAKRFAKAIGAYMYAESGVLYLDDDKQWYGTEKNPQPLNINTGMIGIAHINVAGAIVQRRLDDSAALCSWIRLTSEIMPKANGDYFVIKKKHKGHLRGEEWFTELETFRKQVK